MNPWKRADPSSGMVRLDSAQQQGRSGRGSGDIVSQLENVNAAGEADEGRKSEKM